LRRLATSPTFFQNALCLTAILTHSKNYSNKKKTSSSFLLRYVRQIVIVDFANIEIKFQLFKKTFFLKEVV